MFLLKHVILEQLELFYSMFLWTESQRGLFYSKNLKHTTVISVYSILRLKEGTIQCFSVTAIVFKKRVPPNTCTWFPDTHQCHIWILLCPVRTVWFLQKGLRWWRSCLHSPRPSPPPSAPPPARSEPCLWSRSNLDKKNGCEKASSCSHLLNLQPSNGVNSMRLKGNMIFLLLQKYNKYFYKMEQYNFKKLAKFVWTRAAQYSEKCY